MASEAPRSFFDDPAMLAPPRTVRVPFDGAGAIFAISADPAPVWLALPGLLVLTAIVIWAAAARIRRMEIRYGAE